MPRKDTTWSATETCLICNKQITSSSSKSQEQAIEEARTDMDKHMEVFHNRKIGN